MTACGVLTLHLVAALAMWTGAALTGAPLQLAGALVGALNTAPVAWLALGAAVLAVGWLPNAVTAIGALPVVGGFLLNVVADAVNAPPWISNLSPFVHVARSPAAPPDWPATAAFIAIGAAMVVVGVGGYKRRDMAT